MRREWEWEWDEDLEGCWDINEDGGEGRGGGFTVGKTARLRETDDEERLVEMAQAWGRR
jgi:hypothetical protein